MRTLVWCVAAMVAGAMTCVACSGEGGSAGPQGGGGTAPVADAGSGTGSDGAVASDASAPASCGNQVVEGDELCDGPPVACNSLAAVWASGTAKCRTDCSGYDVSTCTLGAQTTEAVTPKARDPRWKDALCNDGTPFSFDVLLSPGSKKWLIYFEGGGSCDGKYEACNGRPKQLTSSTGRPDDRSPGVEPKIDQSILSRDPTVNPDFHDANIAFGKYCSSDGWSGTNATPQDIHLKTGTVQYVFTGRNNARALVETLFRDYGLDDATSELLFTGNSAGGVGANVNIDLVASRMPKAIADKRLALVSSAAFHNSFWNNPDFTDYGSGKTDAEVAADLLAIYKTDSDPKCKALAAAKGVSIGGCVGGPLTVAAASLPGPTGWGVRTFVAQNRLDQGPMKEHGIPLAETTDPKAIAARAEWLDDMNKGMADVSWLYAPADPQTNSTDDNLHGMISDPIVWTYEPPDHPGVSLRSMIGHFWADRSGGPGERLVFDGDVPHSGESAQ